MYRKSWLVLLVALAFAIGFIGCAGEDGAAGPEGAAGPQGEMGPEGPAGVGLSEYTYVGGQGDYCAHCHGVIFEEWETTLHPEAYADLDAEDTDNPYCVKCHTTGWDASVSYGDSTIVDNDGADMYGYDNYFQVDGDEAAARRAALEGVQCESCHGPVGEADPNTDAFLQKGHISFATIDGAGDTGVSLCSPCHSGQLGEFATSGHGTVFDGDLAAFQAEHFATSESCAGCHSSEGFIALVDDSWSWDEVNHTSGDEANFIGCVTCHDPHANPDGNYQLRTIDDVTLNFDPAYTELVPSTKEVSGYGAGQLCMQCHKARRDYANVSGQIADGYGHFGPHYSPQADMFAGTGSWEIAGYDYSDSTMAHQSMLAGSGCVSCHMRTEEIVHGSLSDHYRHDFTPVAWIDGEEVGNCEGCHPSLTENTFDIGGFQTAMEVKIDELAVLLGYTDFADFYANFDSEAVGVTVPQREAAYTLSFIHYDGSLGVHNTAYATALIDNAIDYMTP